MKTRMIIAAAAWAVFTACAPAGAATLSGGKATPNPARLAAGLSVNVKHTLGVAYYSAEKFACGARLEYSDGSPAEMIAVQAPTSTIVRNKSYSKTGQFTATLSGYAHSGLVACLGSATSWVDVQAGITLLPTADPRPKLTGMTLASGDPTPGVVDLVLNVAADKPGPTCQFNFSLAALSGGTGIAAIPASFALPGIGQKLSLGTLGTGKYRLNLVAATTPGTACLGQTYVDFEVKRRVLLGSALPKITGMSLASSVASPGPVDLMVNVAADRPSPACQFNFSVTTNNSDAGALNVQLAGPIPANFTLPISGVKLPLGTLSASGKYRLWITAVPGADAACAGSATADFEVRRQALHINDELAHVMGMSFVDNEVSPGAVSLLLNLKSDKPGASCPFTLDVMTNNTGADAIAVHVAGPLSYAFALPASAQKVDLGTLPTGKYRLNLVAAGASGPCAGGATAAFEVKRKNLVMTPDITGISIKDSGYDKLNKTWQVDLQGKRASQCTYVIQFTHLPSGKLFTQTGLSSLPVTDNVTFSQEPPYGQYEVEVAPWKGITGYDTVPCIGTHKTTVRHAAPKLGPLDMMKIVSSQLVITSLTGESGYPGDAVGPAAQPSAVRLDMGFQNQDKPTDVCGFTMTVSKGGKEVSQGFRSTQQPNVLAAIRQGLGWGPGEYLISTRSTKFNDVPKLTPCLGKSEHKLTVASGGIITSTMAHSYSCEPTWDAGSIFAVKEKIYCDVTLRQKVVGPPCVYSITVQAPGEAPVLYHQIHQFEGMDIISFEVFRGQNSKKGMAQVSGRAYNIHAWASDEDKASGSACSGEYYGSGVVLFDAVGVLP